MSEQDNVNTDVPSSQLANDQQNKYRARTIRDINERPTPPPIPIIADGILTFDSQACIVGSPKVGKSLFAIQLGLRLAQGGNCLGLEILRPCKVLYLNFEIHEAIMEERVKHMRGRIAVSNVSNFRHLTLLGDDIPQVNKDEGKQKLTDIINTNENDHFKPDILIMDNRWKITLGDPNQEANIKPLCLNLEEIRKTFPPMVIIVVHHHGKGTTGVGAGSSAWDRWVNTSFDMMPHHWEGTVGGLRPSKEVKVEIGGNYTPGRTLSLVRDKWNFWVGGHEVWQKPLTKQQEAQQFIIEELQDGGKAEAQVKAKAIEVGIKDATWEIALSKLKAEEAVVARQDPTKQGKHNILELTPDQED
jgi:hypothetical protein